MLMRKRAWDIMRDDFTRVDEKVGLVDMMGRLRDAVKLDADNHVALVFGKDESLVGVVSMWEVMKRLEQCVFSEEALAQFEEQDWDKAFSRASRSCADKGIEGLLETNIPMVRPSDPLVVVIESFLEHRRGWAVVQDGGKVLGVIFKSDIFSEVSRDVLRHIT